MHLTLQLFWFLFCYFCSVVCNVCVHLLVGKCDWLHLSPLSVCVICLIFAFGLFLASHLFCVLCFSTVSVSSWGADEAVNASLWSRQKWLWWVETLPPSLSLSLFLPQAPPLFILPPLPISVLWYNSCFFPALFDVCFTFSPYVMFSCSPLLSPSFISLLLPLCVPHLCSSPLCPLSVCFVSLSSNSN